MAAHFLGMMTQALHQYPEIEVAVANESLLAEEADSPWTNTRQTNWPVSTTHELYH